MRKVSREGRSEHSAADETPLLRRREDLDCSRGDAGRGEYRGAVSARKRNSNLYYGWSKEFLEAGKKRLVGDTTREATSTEVTDLQILDTYVCTKCPARS